MFLYADSEVIKSFTCFQIAQAEKLPEMICVECLSNVTTACEIKRKCIEADKSLRNKLLEMLKSSVISNTTELQPSEHHETNPSSDVFETFNNESLSSFLVDPEVTQDSTEPSVDQSEIGLRQTRSGAVLRQPEKQTKRKVQIQEEQFSPAPKKKKSSTHKSEFSELKICCKVCGQDFKNSSESRCHCNDKHESDAKEFCCDSCPFVSKRKKNVERHILAVHMKSFKFNCPLSECDRQYTTQAALKLHCVRDHDESSPFECEKCKQKFSCESLLKIHKQRLTCRPRKNKNVEKKFIEKSHVCPHCDFRTAHQFSLTQHVNLIHLNIRKTWKCSHCENTEFSNRISLNQHMFNFHNLSHIRCPECDQAFSNEAQLKLHKDSLKCNARKATEDDFVESESGVMCTLCNRNYRSKKEWITHYFNHHKFNKICDICNIQLSTYASLKNHKKTIHDKIKAFACTKCPKKFSAKHTLEFHLNTHSGIKPYGCKWCSFKASDRSSISKHQKKIHPGQ